MGKIGRSYRSEKYFSEFSFPNNGHQSKRAESVIKKAKDVIIIVFWTTLTALLWGGSAAIVVYTLAKLF